MHSCACGACTCGWGWWSGASLSPHLISSRQGLSETITRLGPARPSDSPVFTSYGTGVTACLTFFMWELRSELGAFSASAIHWATALLLGFVIPFDIADWEILCLSWFCFISWGRSSQTTISVLTLPSEYWGCRHAPPCTWLKLTILNSSSYCDHPPPHHFWLWIFKFTFTFLL